MGYWLYSANGAEAIPPGMLVVRVHPRPEPSVASAPPGPAGHTTRLARTVALRARAVNDGETALTVGAEEAHVSATRVAWDADVGGDLAGRHAVLAILLDRT